MRSDVAVTERAKGVDADGTLDQFGARAHGSPKNDSWEWPIIATVGLAVLLAGVLLELDGFVVVGAAVGMAGILTGCRYYPVQFILVFLAVRPLTDLGPTYGWGPDMNSIAGGLLLLALSSWAWGFRSAFVPPSPAVVGAFLLAGAALLSVPGSFTPIDSMLIALRVLTIVFLFGFAEQHQSKDSKLIWKLAGAVVISALFSGLIVLLQIVEVLSLPSSAVFTVDGQEMRPPGPFLAAPVLATHLYVGVLVLIMLAQKLWATPRFRGLTFHALISGTVLVWFMIQNRSRSPLIALALALGLYLAISYHWRGVLLWLVLVLAAIAVVDPGVVRADELGTGSDPGAEADTFAWRVSYWEQNLPRLSDSPITGIGLGRVAKSNTGGNPPHSTIVQTLVEMGLFGICSYAVFVFALLAALIRRIRGAVTREGHLVWAGVLCLCLGYFAIGLAENLLSQLVSSGPVAVIAGAGLAYRPSRVVST